MLGIDLAGANWQRSPNDQGKDRNSWQRSGQWIASRLDTSGPEQLIRAWVMEGDFIVTSIRTGIATD